MNNFTQEQIEAAKKKREAIIEFGSPIEKAIYMAGEICMWDEMNEECEKKIETVAEQLDAALEDCHNAGIQIKRLNRLIERAHNEGYSNSALKIHRKASLQNFKIQYDL